ncbi:MAG: ATP-binding protein [Pseudohongiella sp.]|uniref:sensor histidine kinase n=1 Tax=Pseudohongiella sp. TaxID=1979412 RepID=UPI0034A00EA5
MDLLPRFQRLYTLRLALLAGVLVPVVLVVAFAGSWALRLLEQQGNERMQEDIELIADAIRLPLSHALERDRIGSINQALNSAFNTNVVYGAYVYDERGQEIARSGRRAARVETDQAAMLAASGDLLSEFSQAGEEEIFSYFVPLTDTGGRINGLLQLTRRGSDFSDYIAMVRQTSLIALAGLCLLLSMIVLVGHHHALGGPLKRMLGGMKKIRGSDSQRRLHNDGPAEIQNLASGINNMLDRIDASQDELVERRQHEMALRLRLEQSEKLATIGRLAAGVAHELGSPLSTLDGKAQQALRDSESEAAEPESRTRRNLKQIRAEAARMEKIIQQLLDYGRDNPLSRVQLDCERQVQQALDKLAPERESKTVSATLEGPALRISVDPLRFDQALSNLIANAIHACRQQIRITWRATVIDGQGMIELRVEDDGDGIQMDDKAKLFDPFFTTKPVGQGTGLGLAVAHAAIKDHGGNITLEAPDQRTDSLGGACFVVRLPDE